MQSFWHQIQIEQLEWQFYSDEKSLSEVWLWKISYKVLNFLALYTLTKGCNFTPSHIFHGQIIVVGVFYQQSSLNFKTFSKFSEIMFESSPVLKFRTGSECALSRNNGRYSLPNPHNRRAISNYSWILL